MDTARGAPAGESANRRTSQYRGSGAIEKPSRRDFLVRRLLKSCPWKTLVVGEISFDESCIDAAFDKRTMA